MAKYTIVVDVDMQIEIPIEAKSIQEAKQKALNYELPSTLNIKAEDVFETRLAYLLNKNRDIVEEY